jgi:hypothetical protein
VNRARPIHVGLAQKRPVGATDASDGTVCYPYTRAGARGDAKHFCCRKRRPRSRKQAEPRRPRESLTTSSCRHANSGERYFQAWGSVRGRRRPIKRQQSGLFGRFTKFTNRPRFTGEVQGQAKPARDWGASAMSRFGARDSTCVVEFTGASAV